MANKVLTEEEQLTISANLGLIQELKALSQQKPEVLRFGPPKQRAINGEALEAFSIYLPTICILTLNRCEIGDQGLENLVKLKKLRSLYLNGNTKITNAGLKTLSQISSLWELQIAGSSTDDEGMIPLFKLLRHTRRVSGLGSKSA